MSDGAGMPAVAGQTWMFSLTPDEWTAVLLSLRIAVVATVVALPFGIAIAWLLARKDFWGKALLDGLVHLPLVLPPVVTGYLLLIAFGRRGIFGAFLADIGIVFSFRWTGAALACGVMGFPLLVRAIRLSIEAVDAKLEDAAWTLGANRFLVFATVTLPLALARHHRRHGAVLRQGARRVRRHHHVRLEHSGRDADHLGRDLHLHADPQCGRGRRAARRGRDRHLADRARRLRMARAARRHALARGLSMLPVDVEKRLGTSRLRRSSRRRTA